MYVVSMIFRNFYVRTVQSFISFDTCVWDVDNLVQYIFKPVCSAMISLNEQKSYEVGSNGPFEESQSKRTRISVSASWHVKRWICIHTKLSTHTISPLFQFDPPCSISFRIIHSWNDLDPSTLLLFCFYNQRRQLYFCYPELSRHWTFYTSWESGLALWSHMVQVHYRLKQNTRIASPQFCSKVSIFAPELQEVRLALTLCEISQYVLPKFC